MERFIGFTARIYRVKPTPEQSSCERISGRLVVSSSQHQLNFSFLAGLAGLAPGHVPTSVSGPATTLEAF